MRFMVAAPGLGDPHADLGGAREADHVHVGGLDQGRCGPGLGRGHQVDDAGREPHLVEDAHQLHHRQGILGAGFTTTVLPMARAGATLPAMFTSGKLYEVMQATTPTGWRTASAFTEPAGGEWRGRGHLRSKGALRPRGAGRCE